MRNSLLVLLVLATAACGGSDKKPALSADDVANTPESQNEDMPAPPAKETEATAPAETTPAPDAPAGGAIKIAAFKLVPSKKNAKSVEIKADGSIVSDGKTVATIKGDQVNEPSGMTMVTVGIDGSLVGANVKPGWKFSGDELDNEDGSKLSVGDDGTITSTNKDGKSETIGKVEGDTSAKRAALISVLLWAPPSAAPAKAAPKKK